MLEKKRMGCVFGTYPDGCPPYIPCSKCEACLENAKPPMVYLLYCSVGWEVSLIGVFDTSEKAAVHIAYNRIMTYSVVPVELNKLIED